MKITLKITPQRSTQYANMAEILATPELLSSPLSPFITAVTTTTLAGQSYAANAFYQEPYTDGRITHIENTDYFVLELSEK